MKDSVNFVICDFPKWEALLSSRPICVEDVSCDIVTSEDVWIVLSYLHLSSRGLRASVSDRPLRGTINIVDGVRLGACQIDADVYCVGCRSDGHYPAICQLVIEQNALGASDGFTHYVPQWTQPGLIPRAPGRSGVRSVGFLGHAGINLAPRFRSQEFRDRLAVRDIELIVKGKSGSRVRWNDYSDVDVLLSIRDIPAAHLRLKPVNKLTNAWLAGIPAMVGDEPAMAALRTGPFDYLLVKTPDDALAALDRLRANAALYSAMVENGRSRVDPFRDESVAARWMEVLEIARADYRRFSRLRALSKDRDHARRSARHAACMAQHAREVHAAYERLGYGPQWWSIEDRVSEIRRS